MKPPKDAYDPNGPKAPGYPGSHPDFKNAKGSPNWVPNPNGRGNGWEAKDGGVWVPTGWGVTPTAAALGHPISRGRLR
jgi:hypothetical protein